jgi:hypothetical protein
MPSALTELSAITRRCVAAQLQPADTELLTKPRN